MAHQETVMDWTDCKEDVRALDDDGKVIYSGPKWVRCAHPDCGALVTHGMMQQNAGGCECGGRRVVAVRKLTKAEIRKLQTGKYPLAEWEHALIHGSAAAA